MEGRWKKLSLLLIIFATTFLFIKSNTYFQWSTRDNFPDRNPLTLEMLLCDIILYRYPGFSFFQVIFPIRNLTNKYLWTLHILKWVTEIFSTIFLINRNIVSMVLRLKNTYIFQKVSWDAWIFGECSVKYQESNMPHWPHWLKLQQNPQLYVLFSVAKRE